MVVHFERDATRGLALVEEAIELARLADDPVLEAMHLHFAKTAHILLGDLAAARTDAERALAIATQCGAPREVGRALADLGELLSRGGDLPGGVERRLGSPHNDN